VRRLNVLCLLAVLGSSLASTDSSLPFDAHWTVTKEQRLALIRRAQVWRPTDIPNVDLRAGPDGIGAFRPNELVTCDYTPRSLHGSSRKFYCALPDGDVVKVRYGAGNREVQGSLLATRLLWALGFVADRVYPVRVSCRGCSADPWKEKDTHHATHEFDPAVIERKPHGHEVWEGDRKTGWAWPELDEVDANLGGAPPEQRDALKLLAVFMQHTDTKSKQQRLLCASSGAAAQGTCDQPYMFLHDLGLTFGRANALNGAGTGSVNLEEWAKTPIWKDRDACIGHLSKSNTGTLGNPHISEAGRSFLADLLVQLTDRQVRDLFEVAQVGRRHGGASVDDWIAAFNQKRNDILTNHCPH
jgi:hypothetical protein